MYHLDIFGNNFLLPSHSPFIRNFSNNRQSFFPPLHRERLMRSKMRVKTLLLGELLLYWQISRCKDDSRSRSLIHGVVKPTRVCLLPHQHCRFPLLICKYALATRERERKATLNGHLTVLIFLARKMCSPSRKEKKILSTESSSYSLASPYRKPRLACAGSSLCVWGFRDVLPINIIAI